MGTHASKPTFAGTSRLSGSTHPAKNTMNQGATKDRASTHAPVGAVGGPYKGAGPSAKKSPTNNFADNPGKAGFTQAGTVTPVKFGSPAARGTNNGGQ